MEFLFDKLWGNFRKIEVDYLYDKMRLTTSKVLQMICVDEMSLSKSQSQVLQFLSSTSNAYCPKSCSHSCVMSPAVLYQRWIKLMFCSIRKREPFPLFTSTRAQQLLISLGEDTLAFRISESNWMTHCNLQKHGGLHQPKGTSYLASLTKDVTKRTLMEFVIPFPISIG